MRKFYPVPLRDSCFKSLKESSANCFAPTEVCSHTSSTFLTSSSGTYLHRSNRIPPVPDRSSVPLLHSSLVQVHRGIDKKPTKIPIASRHIGNGALRELERVAVQFRRFVGSSMLPLSRLVDGRGC